MGVLYLSCISLNPEVNPDWVLSVQQKSFHHTLWGTALGPCKQVTVVKDFRMGKATSFRDFNTGGQMLLETPFPS